MMALAKLPTVPQVAEGRCSVSEFVYDLLSLVASVFGRHDTRAAFRSRHGRSTALVGFEAVSRSVAGFI